ncbi:MAG TPA: ABC transporter substrate-binding protein [Stellaceae bacterium]|nr:ABC transporter substrate-binding protein [Stellaceae bacterium]
MIRRRFLAAMAFATALGLGTVAQADTVPTSAVTARVGVIPVMGTAPIFIADQEGWAKKSGLDLKFQIFESGPNMIQALASGTIDFYVGGVAPLAVARSRGVDVKVIAATATGENVFVATPKLAAYFKPGVKAAEAFKAFHAATGKPARLATQPLGSVPNTTLQYWLWEVAKVDKADATVVEMGIDATQQAVLAGAVEGATIREPTVTIVTKRNPGIKLEASGDELFPGQPGTVVAVNGAFLAKHRDAVQGLVGDLIRAAALATKEPQTVAPFIQVALGKGIVDNATIVTALRSPATKWLIDPNKIIGPAKLMQSYQVKLGALKKEVSFNGLFDTSLYDKANVAAK